MSPKSKDVKDLEILQREYRNMEVNRKAFAEESHLVLRKQQQTLEKLRAENETLKTDILTLQTKSTPLRPVKSFEQSLMDKVYSDVEKYSGQIDHEKSRGVLMEQQITLLRQTIWEKRRTMGGVNAARDNQRLVEKQVRILENRLDQALVKFNKSLAHNRKLRREIDDLRGERVAFDGVYNKLEKELKEKKKQMAQVIEASNQAYENRDRAQLEITAIEQLNGKENEGHRAQMRELSEILERDCAKLLSTRRRVVDYNKKEFPNSGVNNSTSSIVTTATTSNVPSTAGTIVVNERRSSSVYKLKNAAMATQLQTLAKRRERTNNFREAFRKIATATGISDVDELVRHFVANEEQNFSLFTYANEQADEIEGLEVQVNALRQEGDQYKKENGNDESQYRRILKELDDRLNATQTQADKLELKCNESQSSLDDLKFEIETLLIRLRCKNDIPGGPSVTEVNMLHFLGIIEQRANEILKVYRHANKKHFPFTTLTSKSELAGEACEMLSHSLLGIGPTLPMGGEPVVINPPKLADYSSDDSDDDGTGGCGVTTAGTRPFTRDELKTKAESRLHKNHFSKGDHQGGGGKKGAKRGGRRRSTVTMDPGALNRTF